MFISKYEKSKDLFKIKKKKVKKTNLRQNDSKIYWNHKIILKLGKLRKRACKKKNGSKIYRNQEVILKLGKLRKHACGEKNGNKYFIKIRFCQPKTLRNDEKFWS